MIDLVTRSADGTIILVLCETQPWTGTTGILAIQAKLKIYLEFVESGQLVRRFPAAAGKPVKFRLDCSIEPSADELRWINLLVAEWLRPAGIGFEIGLLPPSV